MIRARTAFRMCFRMLFGLVWGGVILAGVPAPAQPASISSERPRQDTATDSTTMPAKVEPPLSFLVPIEGDVYYATNLKIVVRVRGPVPAGLAAVVDRVLLDQSLKLEKELLTLTLTGLQEGAHSIRLMYIDEKDNLRSTPTVRFFMKAPLPEPIVPTTPPVAVAEVPVAVSESDPPPEKPRLKQFGKISARVEWKNDEAASRIVSQSELEGLGTVPETDTTWGYDTLIVGGAEKPLSRNLVATTEISYNARYDRWEGDVKAVVSTAENRFRQPANRLSARVAYGPWAYVQAGDIYPEYNPLILSGTRIRGGEAGAALVLGTSDEERTHWAYAKVASGETQRTIPAYLIRAENEGGYDTTFAAGTRAQSLSAFRVGVGGGEPFDFGVTILKSVEIREDSTFESLNDYLYGATPAENLVAGTDARVGFLDGKLQVYAQGALSFYTRDRSLGAFNTDTSEAAFDPAKYRKILVINSTTSGWEYLASEDSGGSPDYQGFLNASSTYNVGASASVPFQHVVWESDFSYTHLGSGYHSEGNPFLGGNPGDGWNLQQRLGFMENRLHFGLEGSRYLQDFGTYGQLERGGKAEVKYTSEEPQSSIWVNGGVMRQSPQGSSDFRYTQDFAEVNVGGTHQQAGERGALNIFTQYGYTYGRFRIHDTDPETPVYPATYTHAVSTSLSYKPRTSDLLPKMSHTYSDNGVQKPAQSVAVGVQDAFFRKMLRADLNVLAAEYARSTTRNGLGWGQNLAFTLRLNKKQTFKATEKWSHYGDRISVIAGAQYDRTF
jgi:hypothetical protein